MVRMCRLQTGEVMLLPSIALLLQQQELGVFLVSPGRFVEVAQIEGVDAAAGAVVDPSHGVGWGSLGT
jgi:hypothetical protein